MNLHSHTSPSEATDAPILVDILEAARLLSCSRGFIYLLFQRGQLHPIKLGRLTRVRRQEVLAIASGPK